MLTPFKIAMVVLIVLVLAGPKLLPLLGRQMGGLFKGFQEFKDELIDPDDEQEKKSGPKPDNE